MVCCGAGKRMQEQEQPQKPQAAGPEAPQAQRTEQEEPQGHPQRPQQGHEQEQQRHVHFFDSAVHLPTLLRSSHARPEGDENAEGKKDNAGVEKKPSGTSMWPGMLSMHSTNSSASGAHAEAEAVTATASEGNLLGGLVQRIVAGFDEGLLGVKVHTESLKLEPLSGVVEVHGLKVDNPHGFHSAHLLRANKVVLRVNMARLISSLGGVVEVDEVDLDNVDVIYEKALRTSNLNTLLHNIEGDAGKHDNVKHQSSDHSHHEEGHQQPQVALHKISVRNVGAKVCTSLWARAGPRLAVGDIHYEDFDKTSGGAKGLMQVVKLVLATLIKSILASILGKRASDGMAKAASGASTGVTHALHKSHTAFSHVHMPFGHHHSAGGEEAAAEQAEAAKAQPSATWCGYAVPSNWSCCRDASVREEGEITVGQ